MPSRIEIGVSFPRRKRMNSDAKSLPARTHHSPLCSQLFCVCPEACLGELIILYAKMAQKGATFRAPLTTTPSTSIAVTRPCSQSLPGRKAVSQVVRWCIFNVNGAKSGPGTHFYSPLKSKTRVVVSATTSACPAAIAASSRGHRYSMPAAESSAHSPGSEMSDLSPCTKILSLARKFDCFAWNLTLLAVAS
jgi:hypothetical protein